MNGPRSGSGALGLGARLRAAFGRRPAARGAPLAQLRGEGCPACTLALASGARWVAYFVAEGNAEPEGIAALRASVGPCGRHTRSLLAAPGGADVWAHAAVDVAREALRRAGAEDPRAPCPPCTREAWAEGHALAGVLEAMDAPGADGVERRLCLRHLLDALERPMDAGHAARLAAAGRAALGAEHGEELVVRIGGRDPDAIARADLLRTAAPPVRGPPLRDWLRSLFSIDACPICLGEREAVRGALGWLAASSDLEPWELRLCPGHLSTLHALDALTARRVAAAQGAEWSAALARFAEALAAAPARRRAGRDEAVARLLGNRACRACQVARTARERTGALLAAALRDPDLAAAYRGGHGVCLAHLSALPTPAQAGLPRRILRARLALLGWELEEAVRKRSWFARWEPAGPEAGAWRRLPPFLGFD